MHSSKPELLAFLAEVGSGILLGQVWIQPVDRGFRMCHGADRTKPFEELDPLSTSDLRPLALFNPAGGFRPLRGSPDLRGGWRYEARDSEALSVALELVYPGALVDWYAIQCAPSPVTHYRPYVERQTGMYRITAMLTPAQVATTAKACCAVSFCLKRRLWKDEGLNEDPAEAKSISPCLEPCAVLMEFARKVYRMDQDASHALQISGEPLATVRAALEAALENRRSEVRDADFSHPLNPRRLQCVLDRLPAALEKTS